jgi:transmembrane sensor
LAAAVLAALLIGAWYVARPGDLTLETPRGERRQVSLEDGSTLDIDPQSRLRVRFERGRRLVFLDQGRTLFHVAKNPQRPFIVDAARARARAVGTSFAVERGDGAVTVTVAEGRVAVAGANGSATRASEVMVAAGQQVVVSPRGEPGLVKAVNSDMALAWARGVLLFNGAPVSEVARQFNRYNRLQIHVTDPRLADRPITGSFNAGDPESFIAFLEVAGSAQTQRKGELEVLLMPPAEADRDQ